MILVRAFRSPADNREMSAVKTVGAKRPIFLANDGSPGGFFALRLCVPITVATTKLTKSSTATINFIRPSERITCQENPLAFGFGLRALASCQTLRSMSQQDQRPKTY